MEDEAELVLFGDPLVGVIAKAVEGGCLAPEVRRVTADASGWSVWCISDREHEVNGVKPGYRPIYHLHGREAIDGMKDEKGQVILGLIEKVVRHYDRHELWKLKEYNGS